jgi:hypothetical protein
LFAAAHLIITALMPELSPAFPAAAAAAVAANRRDDDKLYAAARLIITALIARIHTVEWTTAIIQHPAGRASQVRLVTGLLCYNVMTLWAYRESDQVQLVQHLAGRAS